MHNNAMKLGLMNVFSCDYSWWSRIRWWRWHWSSTPTTQSSLTLTRWSPPVPQVL